MWRRNPASLEGSYQGNKMLAGLLGKLRLLKDKNIPVMMTPAQNGMALESWGRGEPGGPNWTRPDTLPIEKDSIQIFDNGRVSPKDVLADYAGHYLMNPESPNYDPDLGAMYDQYTKSLSPEMMKDRYEYAKQHFGEKRPFETWLKSSGAPSVMRGYVFDQWPDEFNRKINSPNQIKMLDEIKARMGLTEKSKK